MRTSVGGRADAPFSKRELLRGLFGDGDEDGIECRSHFLGRIADVDGVGIDEHSRAVITVGFDCEQEVEEDDRPLFIRRLERASDCARAGAHELKSAVGAWSRTGRACGRMTRYTSAPARDLGSSSPFFSSLARSFVRSNSASIANE